MEGDRSRPWRGGSPSSPPTAAARGRSDRPHARECYAPAEVVADLLAVLDAAEVDRAVVVAHCHAVPWALRLAAEHPERVAGVVAIAPAIAVAPRLRVHGGGRSGGGPSRSTRRPAGAMRNRHFWRQDGGYRRWIEFFFDQQLPEPHSTKQYEDTVGWALDTDAEAMIAEREGRAAPSGADAEALCRALQLPGARAARHRRPLPTGGPGTAAGRADRR